MRMGSREGFTMRNSIVCTVHLMQSRRLRWEGLILQVRMYGAFKSLTDKLTGKRPLGRSKRRWEISIIMDLKQMCINTRNLVESTQDRNYSRALVSAELIHRVPKAIELDSDSKDNSYLIIISLHWKYIVETNKNIKLFISILGGIIFDSQNI